MRKPDSRLFGLVSRGVRGRVSVRVRLLAIVLISSVTLLAIGVGASSYMVRSGRDARNWAELASSTTTPAVAIVQTFGEERRLSMLQLAGDPAATAQLPEARQRSDAALAALNAKGDEAQKMNPDGSGADIAAYGQLLAQLPKVRAGIDSGQAPPDQVFGLFSTFVAAIVDASMLAARVAPDAGIAVQLGYAVEPLRAGEALSKAVAIGELALVTDNLTAEQRRQFTDYMGEYRGQVRYAQSVLHGERGDELQNIVSGPAWAEVDRMADAIVARTEAAGDESRSATTGSRRTDTRPPLPSTMQAWQDSANKVGSGLLKVWEDKSRDAHAQARARGDRTAIGSLFGGGAVLLVSILAFLAALLLANRFIGRMRRLRRDTLELADERLPDIMRRVSAGEAVDTPTEVSRLDFGSDELGQVAQAFNRAQVVAVSAAVAESNTRAGINTVFLDIAHRSQALVHRQLALLDQAERREENADQLELLFQLDHLATRARRNAENLIILGGKQPGRRWRQPVPLVEVVRGAVAESLDYTRIRIGRIPKVRVNGTAVADLIHLLAELMDNATSYSPPQAGVEVSASVVGRGVAVEVVDQGLGMTADDLDRRNEMLTHPPEFSVAAMSSDNRLGLFVVAKLANRHGISVKLRESAYGGVRAVVLVGSPVLETSDPAVADFDDSGPATGEFAVIGPAPVAQRGRAEADARPELPTRRPELPTRRPEVSTHRPEVPKRRPVAESDAVRDEAKPTVAEDVPSSASEEADAASRRSAWFTSPSDRESQPGAGVFGAPVTAPGSTDPVPSAGPAPRTGGGRPPLPRRVRSSAPTDTPAAGTNSVRQRSADQARNLISAVERGTRQGRRAPAESGAPTPRSDTDEGSDGYFQSK
ncbi:nitrate- and nitrite sensing domain-containing protein [Nocardia nova]|uniref:nitrate- and nitrite sensing domain-containing protein n=1 Tax=Nocardia nova TaxID=37330 RepID=UPI00046D7A45|nr:nitrate- and nitrite sensing domain-containing protein [Nocardia nova]